MTKKISILAGISASALFFAQDVSIIRNTSTIYDNISSLGTARYNAMAGSMGALGGDASVLNTNPAGLGVFITDDVSASLAINSNKSTASLAGKSTSQSISKVNLGSTNGVLSFQTNGQNAWKFVNVGINYVSQSLNDKLQSPGNANIRETIQTTTDYNIFEGHLYETIGHHSKLNLGIGGNYDNKIYIGAAVNFSSVNIEQYDEVKVSSLNTKNLMRIRNSKPGGTWDDWPEELLPKCYKRKTGKTYKSVYGRMEWEKVAPTLTTQFYNYGTGRYGHPEQDRALSLREGAILQSFPGTYIFTKDTNFKFSNGVK